MIASHALDEGLASVILTVHQRLTSDVVLALNLGRVERQVIRATGSLMDATSLDSLSEHVLVHVELENAVDIHVLALEHRVELLGLSHSSGEAVEKDASLALGLAQVVLDKTNDEVVGDELAALHDAISLFAELGASSYCVTEHVASCEMADAEVVSDLGALGSLTGAGGSDHDHIHGRALGALVPALDLGEKVLKANAAKIHL